jgi:hypothetical protein
MNTVIEFGKYKYKTYDYVIKNDLKYCNFIINTNSINKSFINFQKYLKENEDFFKNEYNINELQTFPGINCSDLSEYMKYDLNIVELIKNHTILINTIDYHENIEELTLPSDIFGIFIDYLIRYEVHKKKNIEFTDSRTDNLINCVSFIINDEKIIMPKEIKKSYKRMKKNKATMINILNVSISHSIWFGNYESIKYINTKNIISDRLYNNIIKYIDIKLLNNKIILCNPILDSKEFNIGGDADLIFDNELIDIKTSKYNEIGNNIIDFIQLFLYASLYYKKHNKYINKLTIFNPLYLIEYVVDIQDCEIITKILNILANYNIGLKYQDKIK